MTSGLTRLRLLVFVTIPVTGSCSPGGERPTHDAEPVALLSSAPAWDDSSAWHIDGSAITTVDPEHALLGVADAFLLADGRVVVGSGRLSEVSLFDPAGRFERRLVRKGDGPGEAQRLHGVYPCNGDRIFVDDRTRYAVMTAEGELLRTGVLPAGNPDPWLIQGVDPNCQSVLLRALELRGGPSLGTSARRHTTLAWWNSSSDFALDTVARLVEAEVFNHRQYGGTLETRVPWGEQARWSTSGGVLAYGQWTQPRITVEGASPSRPDRILRWQPRSERVSNEMRDEFSQRRAEGLTRLPPLRDALPELDEFPSIGQFVPEFADVLVDSEGFVWIRDYSPYLLGRPSLFDHGEMLWDHSDALEGVDHWSVIDTAGTFLGRVEIPSRYRVTSISGPSVVVVDRSPLGEEVVRVLEIVGRDR